MDYIIHYEGTSPEPVPLLRIPVVDAAKYSSKPLKWLLFVAGVVLGVEGVLSTLDRDDNNLDMEDVQPTRRELLFRSDQPLRFIDLEGLNDLASSHSTSSSRVGFKEEVQERDGDHCIITGQADELCQAAHLIPHSKGNDYIQAVCHWRTGNEEPCIQSTTDVRNGIFVTSNVHIAISHFSLAILRTPNFALGCEDVLPASAEQTGPFRFTPHHFYSEEKTVGKPLRLQDCRYPVTLGPDLDWPLDWPPDFLLDFVYGVVTVLKYGITATVDTLNEEAAPNYYPQGIRSVAEAQLEQSETSQHKQEHSRKMESRKKQRRERAERRSQRNTQVMRAFDTVLNFWEHHRLGPLGQQALARRKAEAEQLEQERQKIREEHIFEWQKGVLEANN